MLKLLISKIFIIFLITSCSNHPVVEKFSDNADPRTESVKLGSDISLAQRLDVQFLSPENFSNAQDYYNRSLDGLSGGDSAVEVLENVAIGRAYLKKANEFAQVSRSNLKGVIVARSLAIHSGAQSMFSQKFQRLDERLIELTSDIEANDLASDAKRLEQLQAAYLDLELLTIKEVSLGRAKALIDLAIKEGAQQYASSTLAIAKKSLNASEAFIANSRHDQSSISLRSKEVTRIAEYLLKITRDTKKQEAELNAPRIVEISHTNRRLSSKQVDRDLFMFAVSEFSSSEADIYRNKDALLIRLKGLNFPPSQAILAEDNYTILSKLQKVIEKMGKGSVTIEGNTDSVGNKRINQKLSFERAQLVKSYLLSNYKGEPLKITAIGLDSQKPIASNKTDEGRAINRRIDVLVKPY